MTPYRSLLALAVTASLALPSAAVAGDDDDANRILRGVIAPQSHAQFGDRDDDRRWEYGYRIRGDVDDDDDDRWDDDDRRGRWGDDGDD